MTLIAQLIGGYSIVHLLVLLIIILAAVAIV